MLWNGVKIMLEKKQEVFNGSFGKSFEVKKNTKNANRIGFSNTVFKVGETVFVLSEKEHNNLIKKLEDYNIKIKKLEDTIATESNSKSLPGRKSPSRSFTGYFISALIVFVPTIFITNSTGFPIRHSIR